MAAPLTLASVWAAKAAASASRRLGRGGGTAVAGLVGLQLQPNLIAQLAPQLGRGCVIVTGTNGKTTTSRLLTEIARGSGLVPLANASGSNLLRGIAATLAQAVDATGALPDAERTLGIIEVDEATVRLVLPQLRPRVAVFTNLFRDQLDRYGEVEAVAALWRSALTHGSPDLTLVLNADDPSVAALGEGRERVIYFGIEDPSLDRGSVEHASDALNCTCGARLTYDLVYFGHMGHWRCDSCGRWRPKPDVSATGVGLGDGRTLSLTLQPSGQKLAMSLGGLYNVYNAIAAAAAARALSLPSEAVNAALQATGAAFGRQEAFEVGGKRVELFLAKNPAGTNQVLDAIRRDPLRKTALIVLNDGIADGRDISWVWDADFETAAQQFEQVVVSGTRAAEMALRLKYADWPEQTLTVVPDSERALDAALAATDAGACLTVIPTYTAMLRIRDFLARRSGRDPFWRS
ncbi:MAG TPA: MurT ligase domain-containing protein [Dehalococcoidia bacterium]|nr:MurT ligase domain-containing protein [Dehalococcoidia bacterium]